MKINIPFFGKEKKTLTEGKPQTLIWTGTRPPVTFSDRGGRKIKDLRKYWQYYENEQTVWAAINSITYNTVMTGYSLVSENEEAKTFIEDMCEYINLEDALLDATRYTLVYGDSFLEKRKNKKGNVIDLYAVDPKTIIAHYNKYGRVEYYQQIINGNLLPKKIKPENIIHIKFFNSPDSPYGISILKPNEDTIVRKVRTDEALFNAIQRHGTSKIVAYVGDKDDGIPSEEVMESIQEKLEDITEINDFVVPWLIKIDTIDEKGVQGVNEYYDLFQNQLIVGLMCPEEALGQGKGSTEACYDDKTEVLTNNGWKLHRNLTDEDLVSTYNPISNKLEFLKPLEPVDTHIYDHDGPMIRFKSQKIDIMVTPNHRMWVNKNPTLTKENWEFVTAEEIYNSNSQWAIKYKANKEELSDDYSLKQDIDDFYSLIGYYISEGSLNKDKSIFRLSQKKSESAKRIQNLIDSISNTYKFSVGYSDSKGYEWRCSDKNLRKIFSEFGDDCYTKKIPRKYIDNTPVEYLETLLYSSIDGDGTIDNRENRNYMEYATSSKQLADDIQEIAIRCGYRTNLIFSEDNRQNRVGMWRVSIDTKKKDYVVITPSMCEKVYYQGKTYCLNVPNHIYLTRRNGKIAIQGNTARIKAILYERMIKSFQRKLSNIIKKELFNQELIIAGFSDKDSERAINVRIKFNSVTEEDEAMRAKWIGNLLRGFPEGVQPFSINEIRGLMGLPHREGMDDLYVKQRGDKGKENVKEPDAKPVEEEPKEPKTPKKPKKTKKPKKPVKEKKNNENK